MDKESQQILQRIRKRSGLNSKRIVSKATTI